MKYFVTGFHRAGTHSYADNLALWQNYRVDINLKDGTVLPRRYIEEAVIKWDDFDKAIAIADKLENVVIQCPGLAHRVIDLAKHGKVYWLTRNKTDIITSMKNACIGDMAWHLMKGFRQQFPSDPIWNTLSYDGSKDAKMGYIKYYSLLIDVKEYFYQKHFKYKAKLIKIEDMPYYNYSKTLTAKMPLKIHESIHLRETSAAS